MTHPVDAPGRRRTIACYVAPRLFARRTRAALQGLGYHVVPVATRGRFEDASWRPDLRLVDERHLERLPREADGVPIVCLSERPEREPADPRIVGFAPRPGELSALYPLLQRALEPHPRRDIGMARQMAGEKGEDGGRGVIGIHSLSGAKFPRDWVRL